MSAAVQSLAGWQAGFLSLLPAVRTHAKIRFRRLPRHRREEAVQEAIAAAYTSYQSAAVQGKLGVVRPSTLADFAVRHVRTGRHVGGRQDPARDVMSPECQERHGVRVRSFHIPASGDGADVWKQVVIADRKASVPDTAAFRVDFSDWLKTLARRDRRIIAALAGGETTSAVAGRFYVSAGRVSQLRRKYERLWRGFQGEAACGAA